MSWGDSEKNRWFQLDVSISMLWSSSGRPFSRRRSEHTDRNVELKPRFFSEPPKLIRDSHYMVLPQTFLYSWMAGFEKMVTALQRKTNHFHLNISKQTEAKLIKIIPRRILAACCAPMCLMFFLGGCEEYNKKIASHGGWGLSQICHLDYTLFYP